MEVAIKRLAQIELALERKNLNLLKEEVKQVRWFLSKQTSHPVQAGVVKSESSNGAVADTVEINKEYKRPNDMNPDETFGIFIEEDNDVIVTIYNEEKGTSQIQFCTSAGGGKSLKTRRALLDVVKAMIEDSKQATASL